ncbi:MAG: AMP-binding protein [Hyphomicrobiaceae bacterium]
MDRKIEMMTSSTAPLDDSSPASAGPARGFDAARARTTLFGAVLDSARIHGKSKLVLEDAENPPISYGRLILGALILGEKIATASERRETVALLLPNTNALAVTLLGLNAYGRVAAMLNFTAGTRNILAAVEIAEVKRIVTSRRFIEIAGLEDLIASLGASPTATGEPRQILYLEDVRDSVGAWAKLTGTLAAARAAATHRKHALAPDDPAVVLFTSGTEAAPKAVVLSNANVVANALQVLAHADGVIGPEDRIMNPLPMFHSFGLTAGTLMPLIGGLSAILYPSPLRYKEIPKVIRERRPTILLATDTFLQGYARSAEPGDFATLRYVVAGAERVKEATRTLWRDHDVELLEGYGATECAPVLAVNLPDTNTPGTVGHLLPGLEARLNPVEGISTGGRLEVRGPNVMLGYMMADAPGVLVPPREGWHDTGDIVDINAAGFVSIKGRAKRFAKVGGEMVSLAAIEGLVAQAYPEHNHVVLARNDERRGEQLILITECHDADRSTLLACARDAGFPELWLPRQIITVKAIPLLGSGKVDFPAATRLLSDQSTAAGGAARCDSPPNT